MFNLNGKVALVTGSSRGIGRDIALALAKAGCDVIVHSKSNVIKAEQVADEIRKLHRKSFAISCDTRDAIDINDMFKSIVKQTGKIDILVNNAAVLSREPILDMSVEEWDRIMETNARGYFLCTKYAAQIMRTNNKGRIINVSSVSQYQAAENRSHYCASKGAISMLTKCAALEFAKYGITVNSVLPGSIHTDFNNDVLSDPEYYQNTLNGIPLGRLGKPSDISGAVVYLASDEAEFVSGANIVIDGAMTVK